MDFVNTQVGVAVGDDGVALRTTDGGKTWKRLAPGTGEDLTAVCFDTSQRGWVVGDDGVRLRTTDGGATWRGQL